MSFASGAYLLFFLVVFAIGWLLSGRLRARVWILLGASLFFYASNNGWQVLILLFTTTLDYVAARRIFGSKNRRVRRAWMVASIGANLGVLAWFKYANFLLDGVRSAILAFGAPFDVGQIAIALPVGISFFTFEAMSYTIDVYRGQIEPQRSWHRVAFFVAYFPHLVAGPILRAGDFIPQLDRPPRLDVAGLERGLLRIFRGLAKKIVLADLLARVADAAFADPAAAGTVGAWLGLWAFTFQIYFDFSGYTDIALGCAQIMGFTLPENFDNPYTARSVTEFWRRWHISLSNWLRDYLYIPLGGNRMASKAGVCRNLLLTMGIAGLWHGAAWHFVAWGLLHGLLMSAELISGMPARIEAFAAGGRLRRVLLAFFAFQAFALLWLPFRAGSLADVARYATILAQWVPGRPVTISAAAVPAVAALALLTQHFGRVGLVGRLEPLLPPWVRAGIYAVVSLLVLVLGSGGAQPFIYFQF